jgi:hypothetical protein
MQRCSSQLKPNVDAKTAVENRVKFRPHLLGNKDYLPVTSLTILPPYVSRLTLKERRPLIAYPTSLKAQRMAGQTFSHVADMSRVPFFPRHVCEFPDW